MVSLLPNIFYEILRLAIVRLAALQIKGIAARRCAHELMSSDPSITVVILLWHICLISESMGHHDSEIMDDRSID
jgi:hypothetical protein